MTLQDLIKQYGADWVIRAGRAGGKASATRRRQLPIGTALRTALAMTVEAPDLTALAAELAEQAIEAERVAKEGKWPTT